MEPKRIYRAFKENVPEESYEISLGEANVLREGKDRYADIVGRHDQAGPGGRRDRRGIGL